MESWFIYLIVGSLVLLLVIIGVYESIHNEKEKSATVKKTENATEAEGDAKTVNITTTGNVEEIEDATKTENAAETEDDTITENAAETEDDTITENAAETEDDTITENTAEIGNVTTAEDDAKTGNVPTASKERTVEVSSQKREELKQMEIYDNMSEDSMDPDIVPFVRLLKNNSRIPCIEYQPIEDGKVNWVLSYEQVIPDAYDDSRPFFHYVQICQKKDLDMEACVSVYDFLNTEEKEKIDEAIKKASQELGIPLSPLCMDSCYGPCMHFTFGMKNIFGDTNKLIRTMANSITYILVDIDMFLSPYFHNEFGE